MSSRSITELKFLKQLKNYIVLLYYDIIQDETYILKKVEIWQLDARL